MKHNNVQRIAISGSSGSGKSTVLQYLDKLGYKTKDYDEFAVEFIQKSDLVYSKLEEIIEIDIRIDGGVNLKQIGDFFEKHLDKEVVFEKWYQPLLGKEIKNSILISDENGTYFYDIPYIDKKKIVDFFDEIWIITANIDECCKRIKKRNGYSDKKTRYLVNRSLICIDGRSNVFYIENNNDYTKLRINVDEQLMRLKSEKKLNS